MRRTRRRGFSIIEVLISFMVLTVAILALLGLMPAASKQGSTTGKQSQALYIAQSHMDNLISQNTFNAAGTIPLPALATGASARWWCTAGPDGNTQVLHVEVVWLEFGRSRRVELASMVYR
ncbi:MAG: hypothetical protein AMXMBFR33_53890 [Candidatus Xenobia bacterium]